MTATPPESIREQRGRLVRDTWVTWALEQAAPKPHWLIGWDGLSKDQREVDMRIGEAAAAAERDRIIALASQLRAAIPADHPPGAQASFADYLRVTAAGDTP